MNCRNLEANIGCSYEYLDAITSAAEWLVATPQVERPCPIMLHIRWTYGLSAIEAVQAIREAKAIQCRPLWT